MNQRKKFSRIYIILMPTKQGSYQYNIIRIFISYLDE